MSQVTGIGQQTVVRFVRSADELAANRRSIRDATFGINQTNAAQNATTNELARLNVSSNVTTNVINNTPATTQNNQLSFAEEILQQAAQQTFAEVINQGNSDATAAQNNAFNFAQTISNQQTASVQIGQSDLENVRSFSVSSDNLSRRGSIPELGKLALQGGARLAENAGQPAPVTNNAVQATPTATTQAATTANQTTARTAQPVGNPGQRGPFAASFLTGAQLDQLI